MRVSTFLLAVLVGFYWDGLRGACIGGGVGWLAAAFLAFRADENAKTRLETIEAALGNIEQYTGNAATELSAIDKRLDRLERRQ